MLNGIIIDPVLRPGFDTTPYEERCELEIKDWWGLPFIEPIKFEQRHIGLTGPALKKARESWLVRWPEGIRYDVQRLDGGSWDRPTSRGEFPTLEEAIEFAKELAKAPR